MYMSTNLGQFQNIIRDALYCRRANTIQTERNDLKQHNDEDKDHDAKGYDIVDPPTTYLRGGVREASFTLFRLTCHCILNSNTL